MSLPRTQCPRCGKHVPIKPRQRGKESAQRAHAVKDHLRSSQCSKGGGSKPTNR